MCIITCVRMYVCVRYVAQCVYEMCKGVCVCKIYLFINIIIVSEKLRPDYHYYH